MKFLLKTEMNDLCRPYEEGQALKSVYSGYASFDKGNAELLKLLYAVSIWIIRKTTTTEAFRSGT